MAEESTTSNAHRSDWTDAFAEKSSAAFGAAFAEDVVLEASVLRRPITGRRQVAHVLEVASGIYESLTFEHQTVDGDRTYLEWEAVALGGTVLRGVTVLTRNSGGLVTRAAIHHRPLDAVLAFSAEVARRTSGVVEASYFASH
ncbi:SnoaL-like domain-containing protein [Lentzea xinjiangensis]|uniref:SnoaL-like domain-containing protein n=1 Tax=Lentzea xinjiangensis TaxID=402600 RepID=A0A1H9PE72_9PSEU|nr:nuclear transport factor 2 family protein [Lentzea xinjiangensis]SER46484.1 SnoaL-like domain-containing protein [Lentzea xinjiangensis]